MQTRPEAKSRPQPIFFGRSICRFQMSLMGRNMTVVICQHTNPRKRCISRRTHEVRQRVHGISIVEICSLSTDFGMRQALYALVEEGLGVVACQSWTRDDASSPCLNILSWFLHICCV
jgi:hypothetical protein